MDIIKNWSLQMFGEGGEGAAAPAAGNAEGQQDSLPGGAPQPGQQSGDAAQAQTLDQLLESDPALKAAYEHKLRGHLSNRMKNANAERAQLQQQMAQLQEQTRAIYETLGPRYGLDVSDPGKMDLQALGARLMADDAMLEQEAADRGMTVENLRALRQSEAAARRSRAMEAELRRRQELMEIREEAATMQELYPGFDLDTEMQNPSFGRMLAMMKRTGYENPVHNAYKLVHMDELMGGAMQYAVQRTKQQVSNSIQSGVQRPAENGAAAAAAQMHIDPAKLTPEQRKDIRQRVMRGEKITF